ncbi:hypothetical protein C8R45DRAFT_885299 [Mycena sanguinolenta]|nr:hypothetical protein C8R45DRAFT_885299 [Mycena sanguinolenta]
MSSPSQHKGAEETAINRSELWFSDGSVVLQAQTTQFRVHLGVLPKHSSIFRDMQALPQPPDEPTFEGCPIVRLLDDPTDLEYVLNTLYDPAFLAQKTLPLEAVGAFIRLGRKYDFRALVDSAVARIAAVCPRTLEEYDALNSSNTQHIEMYPGIEVDMLALVSENGIMSALPSACYRALQPWKYIGDLFDGTLREDGTQAYFSQIDLRRCTIGHEKLSRQQFETRTWEVDNCASPTRCRNGRQGIREALDQYLVYALVTGVKSAQLCAVCSQHVTESMTAGRKKIWEELPLMFDLPPWDQLKNDL